MKYWIKIKLFCVCPLSRVQESGVADYMGMFAVACMGCDEMVKKFEDLNDDYSKIMVQVQDTAVLSDTK